VPVLLDTGIVYAYYDRSDAWHARAAALIRAEAGGLLMPAPVIPEVDHLLGHRLGAKARQAYYRALADGDYLVADLPHDRYDDVAALDRRSGVTGVRRVATADRRHFEPLAAALSLELLP
jgi:predicted nucleic acid-binding protein